MAVPDDSTAAQVSLPDVAHAAGVSKSLASRALRGDSGVSPQRRAFIIDAADAVGYPVTEYARRCARGEAVLLAAVVTDLANPFHTEVLVGAERAARRAGVSIVALDGMHDSTWLESRLSSISRLDVSGAIIVSTWFGADVLKRAAEERPIVVVGSIPEDLPDIDTVDTDDLDGIQMIVDHLVAIGHKRIAFASESERASSVRRQRDYVASMNRFYGLGSTTTVHIADLESDPERLRKLLDTGVTAVIAANDSMAVRVVNVAEQIGAVVPDDLAVTGYDNTVYASLLRPRLTSADQPREAMGARAAELMIERLMGRTVAKHETLRPTLKVRESTMPPLARG